MSVREVITNVKFGTEPGDRFFLMSLLAIRREPTGVEGESALVAAHIPLAVNKPGEEAARRFGEYVAKEKFPESEGWGEHDVSVLDVTDLLRGVVTVRVG